MNLMNLLNKIYFAFDLSRGEFCLRTKKYHMQFGFVNEQIIACVNMIHLIIICNWQ